MAEAEQSGQIGDITARLKLLMFGTDENKNRVRTNSFWDIVSRKYAENVSGDVRVILPEIPSDRSVWTVSKLPALLENVKVTSINGVPREKLAALGRQYDWRCGNTRSAINGDCAR